MYFVFTGRWSYNRGGGGGGVGVGRGLKVAVYGNGFCIEAPYCPQNFFHCYSIFFVTGICDILELFSLADVLNCHLRPNNGMYYSLLLG